MPRQARAAPGGIVYHALNRGNGRTELFHKSQDYAAFERIMVAAMAPWTDLRLGCWHTA